MEEGGAGEGGIGGGGDFGGGARGEDVWGEDVEFEWRGEGGGKAGIWYTNFGTLGWNRGNWALFFGGHNRGGVEFLMVLCGFGFVYVHFPYF